MSCLSDPGIYHAGVFPKENKIFSGEQGSHLRHLYGSIEQSGEGDEETGGHPPVPSSHQQLRIAACTHAHTRIPREVRVSSEFLRSTLHGYKMPVS